MNYIIYNSNTGQIHRTGSCPEAYIEIQCLDGEKLLIGDANPLTQYVLSGEVTTYTGAEQSAKDNLTYGYAWAMPERAVVQILTDDEITAYLATQARAKREQLLTSCDWTQTADQSSAIKTLWQPYRQALRDITLQAEFPATIVWPTPPT